MPFRPSSQGVRTVAGPSDIGRRPQSVHPHAHSEDVTSSSAEVHRFVLFPDRYDIHTATAAACSCEVPGCEEFPTGERGLWDRANPAVSVTELRWRARRLDRAHARFTRRAARIPKEGVVGTVHVGGGKDWGRYRGTFSSLAGLAEVIRGERLLVDEELRRRGVRAVPPASGRWWHDLVPTTDAVFWVALGALIGTVAGWALIGILYAVVGLTSGDWAFDSDTLCVWGATTAISVAASLRNLIDD